MLYGQPLQDAWCDYLGLGKAIPVIDICNSRHYPTPQQQSKVLYIRHLMIL